MQKFCSGIPPYLGIPPVLYLTMNQTIQRDTKELILKLLRVNLNRLSHETQAEVRRVAGLEKCEGNVEENIEAPIEMREIGGTHNQSSWKLAEIKEISDIRYHIWTNIIWTMVK